MNTPQKQPRRQNGLSPEPIMKTTPLRSQTKIRDGQPTINVVSADTEHEIGFLSPNKMLMKLPAQRSVSNIRDSPQQTLGFNYKQAAIRTKTTAGGNKLELPDEISDHKYSRVESPKKSQKSHRSHKSKRSQRS